MRKVASVAVLVVSTTLFFVALGRAAGAQTGASGASGATGAKTCADFKTQAEAQSYFNSKGGSKTNNVDNLDPNRNGIACEGLPGTPSASASPTPAPTAAGTAKPLPNNGVFSDIMAMSGLSLLEAGIALSLVSERIRSRGKRVPLGVLKMLAKAARKGRTEVALADDLYIVRKPGGAVADQARSEPKHAAPAQRVSVFFTPPVATPPSKPNKPVGDEWTAAVTLDQATRDDGDWPYFTPPS